MLNFQIQGPDPICKVDSCTIEGVHNKHRIRVWCPDWACTSSIESAPEGVLRLPRVSGEVVCTCGQLMTTREPGKSPWRDVANRATQRLNTLRKLDPAVKLQCPWREAFRKCWSCRCGGTGEVIAGQLVAHYEAMVERYESRDLSALDDAIVSSVTRYEPKRFAEVLDDVENNYGTISPKRETSKRLLHRHLKALAERGRVLRIDVGESLCAYLKPDSPIAGDPRSILEYFRATMEMS